VPRGEVGDRLVVDVVRTPLLRYLAGSGPIYYAVADAGITIEFAD
jgi:hypothetical protein